MPNREGSKRCWIGQLAGKPRIEETSTTSLKRRRVNIYIDSKWGNLSV